MNGLASRFLFRLPHLCVPKHLGDSPDVGPPGMPVARMTYDKVTVAAERNEILWVQFLSSRMDRVDVVDL